MRMKKPDFIYFCENLSLKNFQAVTLPISSLQTVSLAGCIWKWWDLANGQFEFYLKNISKWVDHLKTCISFFFSGDFSFLFNRAFLLIKPSPGDNMGLDPSREKLYRVWDNVQDFKGKAAASVSSQKHLEKLFTVKTLREYKVENWGMHLYNWLVYLHVFYFNPTETLRVQIELFILCRFEVTLNLSAIHYLGTRDGKFDSYTFTC